MVLSIVFQGLDLMASGSLQVSPHHRVIFGRPGGLPQAHERWMKLDAMNCFFLVVVVVYFHHVLAFIYFVSDKGKL